MDSAEKVRADFSATAKDCHEVLVSVCVTHHFFFIRKQVGVFIPRSRFVCVVDIAVRRDSSGTVELE